MNLQKRECPIKMKRLPEYLGWADVDFVVQGRDHHYNV